jgi:hypothetical protein
MGNISLSKAKQSTNAIERLYITMRYLFNKGKYTPNSTLGKTLKQLLLLLNPEIYGSIGETQKIELEGLIYVIDRLPQGIESYRYIYLTTNERYVHYNLHSIKAPKRRRNCYKIDDYQINIEITRGRSDIYDILTHLTFLFIEGEKIMQKAYINRTEKISREWSFIENMIKNKIYSKNQNSEIGLIHLSSILGRTFEETLNAYNYFKNNTDNENRLFEIIYWMGKNTFEEEYNNKKRIISFSNILRDRIGHHFYGEIWAKNIKQTLDNHGLIEKKLHIISANKHSVMNILYAAKALHKNEINKETEMNIYKILSNNNQLNQKVKSFAIKNGMIEISDQSGTNIDVQIIDLSKIDFSYTFIKKPKNIHDILIVMDYAFGEQAFEVMDELLKPYQQSNVKYRMLVNSISIMGKAGILTGKKGDIMIPNSHIFEGHADNYPFKNYISKKNFIHDNIPVFTGPMITVLGTSLQNKNILKYFKNSTWKAIGLEMEGAYYQKAIQAASSIRNHISKKVIIRYAYYASDNPLKTGSTLASGNLGIRGVKPTYLITKKFLEQILN